MPIRLCKDKDCPKCGTPMNERAKVQDETFIPFMECPNCGMEDYSDFNESVKALVGQVQP